MYELKILENSRDRQTSLLFQDSYINGTFHLENTQSLENFKEIEKMCEGSQNQQSKPNSRLLGSCENSLIIDAT